MAGEIQVSYITGKTLDAIVRNSVGQVLTIAGLTFGTYATASRAGYLISVVEQGIASAYFAGDFPVVPAGVYTVIIYVRTTPLTAAESDVAVTGGSIEWDGSAIVSLASRAKPTDIVTGGAIGTGSGSLTGSLLGNIGGNIIGNLSSSERNAIAGALLDLGNGVESTITLRQALRLMLAASAGKVSGAAGTTVTIRNVGDTKNRIVATVDASGNRTAVTTDGT